MSEIRKTLEAHVAAAEKRMAEERDNPDLAKSRRQSYWDIVSPTYIENWPRTLMNLSVATVDIPLKVEDCERLISNNGEFAEGIEGAPHNIDDIVERMDVAIKQFPKGAFVRLGSRSPKDSYRGYEKKFKCESGKDAITFLCDTSERMYEDLNLAKIMGHAPHIFIREYVDIPVWAEFRCFVENKHLIGVSQYNYFAKRQEEIVQNAEAIHWAIETAFDTLIMPELHLWNVVVDVFVKKRTSGNENIWDVKLLEINPYFGWTDPCMFKWVDSQVTGVTLMEQGEFRYFKD